MALDIINAIIALTCTVYIFHICKVNPRRIIPLKFTPDDYCLLGYVLGPIVCYITFFICGVYFLALDNRSDKFTQCMETLGTINQLFSKFIYR